MSWPDPGWEGSARGICQAVGWGSFPGACLTVRFPGARSDPAQVAPASWGAGQVGGGTKERDGAQGAPLAPRASPPLLEGRDRHGLSPRHASPCSCLSRSLQMWLGSVPGPMALLLRGRVARAWGQAPSCKLPWKYSPGMGTGISRIWRGGGGVTDPGVILRMTFSGESGAAGGLTAGVNL